MPGAAACGLVTGTARRAAQIETLNPDFHGTRVTDPVTHEQVLCVLGGVGEGAMCCDVMCAWACVHGGPRDALAQVLHYPSYKRWPKVRARTAFAAAQPNPLRPRAPVPRRQYFYAHERRRGRRRNVTLGVHLRGAEGQWSTPVRCRKCCFAHVYSIQWLVVFWFLLVWLVCVSLLSCCVGGSPGLVPRPHYLLDPVVPHLPRGHPAGPLRGHVSGAPSTDMRSPIAASPPRRCPARADTDMRFSMRALLLARARADGCRHGPARMGAVEPDHEEARALNHAVGELPHRGGVAAVRGGDTHGALFAMGAAGDACCVCVGITGGCSVLCS